MPNVVPLTSGRAGQVVEVRRRIRGPLVSRDAADERHQALALVVVAESGLDVERRPIALAVIHVGQQHGITGIGQRGGHVEEGLPESAGVGNHDHAWPGALSFRGEQADRRGAVGSGDGVGDVRHGIRSTPRELDVIHWRRPAAPCFAALAIAAGPDGVDPPRPASQRLRSPLDPMASTRRALLRSACDRR